jgi:hypothetical protein
MMRDGGPRSKPLIYFRTSPKIEVLRQTGQFGDEMRLRYG